MKKISIFLSLAVVLVCLSSMLLTGCSEDATRPVITRVTISQDCGVAPLVVEFRAFASGGTRFDQPTTGNNFLEFEWDFGDGNTSEASQTYHEYETPGDYHVVVVATDAEGLTATESTDICVRGNIFNVNAVHAPASNRIQAGSIVHFSYEVDACGIEVDDPNGHNHFIPVWTLLDTMVVNNHEFVVTMPNHALMDTVILNVNYFSASATVADTVFIEVYEPGQHGEPADDDGGLEG